MRNILGEWGPAPSSLEKHKSIQSVLFMMRHRAAEHTWEIFTNALIGLFSIHEITEAPWLLTVILIDWGKSHGVHPSQSTWLIMLSSSLKLQTRGVHRDRDLGGHKKKSRWNREGSHEAKKDHVNRHWSILGMAGCSGGAFTASIHSCSVSALS